MTYRVIVTPQAEADLRSAYLYIRGGAPQAAREGIRRARKAIRTLSRYPERCRLSEESISFAEPTRELLFGSGNRGTFRMLFVILDGTVYVLHVRHGSRLPLAPPEE